MKLRLAPAPAPAAPTEAGSGPTDPPETLLATSISDVAPSRKDDKDAGVGAGAPGVERAEEGAGADSAVGAREAAAAEEEDGPEEGVGKAEPGEGQERPPPLPPLLLLAKGRLRCTSDVWKETGCYTSCRSTYPTDLSHIKVALSLSLIVNYFCIQADVVMTHP